MKIFIICSNHFYNKVNEIKKQLEEIGHKITLPNLYENPSKRNEMKKLSKKEYIKVKQQMMKLYEPKVKKNDAVLVINFEKNGIQNYIGGATFLEIYTAWKLNKKIFFYNPLPECSFTDELIGMNPTLINGNLNLIK